ncbi:ATP-dependent DNA ligase [Georgenia muralis]
MDGELGAWTNNRLDFGTLQQRLATSPARPSPSAPHRQSASHVGFDVLTLAGQDVRPLPFTERRELLEQLATRWAPPFNLSPTDI